MNIFGASGHAKVIIDLIHSKNEERIDYIFDDNCSIKKIMEYKITHEDVPALLDAFPTIVAIGNNKTRKEIATKIKLVQPYISHNSAVISPSARIKEGTVIMANSTVNAEANIGRHCIINTGAVIEHDVELSNYVHISPNAAIAGNVRIGEGAHIGTGASIIPGIKIGKWVMAGAGAVIIEDIPDFAVVVGNPGKIIKYIDE